MMVRKSKIDEDCEGLSVVGDSRFRGSHLSSTKKNSRKQFKQAALSICFWERSLAEGHRADLRGPVAAIARESGMSF